MEHREKAYLDPSQWSSIDALLSRLSDLRELSGRIGMALRKRSCVNEISEVPGRTGDMEATNNDIADRNPSAGQKWSIKPEYQLLRVFVCSVC
jgi:hypothetical protein